MLAPLANLPLGNSIIFTIVFAPLGKMASRTPKWRIVVAVVVVVVAAVVAVIAVVVVTLSVEVVTLVVRDVAESAEYI